MHIISIEQWLLLAVKTLQEKYCSVKLVKFRRAYLKLQEIKESGE